MHSTTFLSFVFLRYRCDISHFPFKTSLFQFETEILDCTATFNSEASSHVPCYRPPSASDPPSRGPEKNSFLKLINMDHDQIIQAHHSPMPGLPNSPQPPPGFSGPPFFGSGFNTEPPFRGPQPFGGNGATGWPRVEVTGRPP